MVTIPSPASEPTSEAAHPDQLAAICANALVEVSDLSVAEEVLKAPLTSVTDAIPIKIQLILIRSRWAVIAEINDAVSIHVLITEVSQAILITVPLEGIEELRAEVAQMPELRRTQRRREDALPATPTTTTASPGPRALDADRAAPPDTTHETRPAPTGDGEQQGGR